MSSLARIIGIIGIPAFIVCATAGATSTPLEKGPISPKSSFSTDMSDLWWNPNESGWGMQLVQQGSVIYATLFIYGSDGKPTWATAPLNPVGSFTWSGPLYITSGPWYGGSFDPAAVGARQAGSLTFSAAFVSAGTVTYSIDGVQVTKQIERQLFNYDNYNGSYAVSVNLTQSSCYFSGANGTITGLFGISVSQSGTNMAMTWQFPSGDSCVYSGSYSQAGRMGMFQGTYACSDGEVGQMKFFEMTNRIGMLSGRLQGQSTNAGCHYTGRFTGLDPNKP